MRNIGGERAAKQITQAYGTWTTQGNAGWMKTTEIFDRTDLSMQEATEGVEFLNASRTGWIFAHDPARLDQSAEDIAAEIPFGPEKVGILIRQ